ncbi:MAG: restriction endonuclease subunit S [Bacteroidales bacterium]|nr:restriction endonuclease subunit S [Bacteroidales bacterium]
MTYLRLGDYIREVNVRNRELKVTKLVGLTIDKAFIPSVANVIGTDLSNYKVICREQFACSLMQVSRDGKMPVAMFEEDEAIMSPAYPMFEVVDKTKLLPQYLMMWFSRSEFDREASYYAVGGVRGSLTWEDFCNMQLPVPSIERQQEIVSEYETLSRRIRLNEQMIARLEETAHALYRKMFVDGIDKENLPEGWRWGTIKDEVEIIDNRGKTPPVKRMKTKYPLIEIASIRSSGYLIDYEKCEKWVTETIYNNWFRRGHPKRKDILISTVGSLAELKIFWDDKGCIAQNIVAFRSINSSFALFLYHYLLAHKNDLLSYEIGSVQASIKVSQLINYKIIIPAFEILRKFDNNVSYLYDMMSLFKRDITILTELQSLLLARMGQ